VSFTTPFDLAAGQYFFVPQVQLANENEDFFWLSAPRPETPFPPGFTDLQSWTRDQFLEPDWLRVGTDITGQGPFNAALRAQRRDCPRSHRSCWTARPDLGLQWSSRLGATPSADRLSRQDGAGALCLVPKVLKFERVAVALVFRSSERGVPFKANRDLRFVNVIRAAFEY
jgi:hypothetical protein